MTLNADGTGSIANSRKSGFTLTQGAWSVAPVNGQDAFPINWAYNNGVVTVSLPDATSIVFDVAAGGRVLTGTEVQASNDNSVGLIVMTRLQ
jgi:hypothetical protein